MPDGDMRPPRAYGRRISAPAPSIAFQAVLGSASVFRASSASTNRTPPGETMAEQAVVPVSRFLDERGLTSFHIALMVWTVLLALIDGYDIAAIAVASPHLVRDWHLANRAAFGPVLSASLIGILFGSAIFGWIGDRYGRKVALISSNLLFGIFTWIAAYATNLDQMFWLRLIAGLGIGGVIPNVV